MAFTSRGSTMPCLHPSVHIALITVWLSSSQSRSVLAARSTNSWPALQPQDLASSYGPHGARNLQENSSVDQTVALTGLQLLQLINSSAAQSNARILAAGVIEMNQAALDQFPNGITINNRNVAIAADRLDDSTFSPLTIRWGRKVGLLNMVGNAGLRFEGITNLDVAPSWEPEAQTLQYQTQLGMFPTVTFTPNTSLEATRSTTYRYAVNCSATVTPEAIRALEPTFGTGLTVSYDPNLPGPIISLPNDVRYTVPVTTRAGFATSVAVGNVYAHSTNNRIVCQPDTAATGNLTDANGSKPTTPGTLPPLGAPEPPQGAPSSGSTLAWWAWLLIALGIVVVLVGVVGATLLLLAKRKRHQRKATVKHTAERSDQSTGPGDDMCAALRSDSNPVSTPLSKRQDTAAAAAAAKASSTHQVEAASVAAVLFGYPQGGPGTLEGGPLRPLPEPIKSPFSNFVPKTHPDSFAGKTVDNWQRQSDELPPETFPVKGGDAPAMGGSFLHVPNVPGDLILGRLIGKGAFGRVYKAWWKGVLVAVKVIDHFTSTKDGNNRTLRESEVAVGVTHPNIVATYKLYHTGSNGDMLEASRSTSRTTSGDIMPTSRNNSHKLSNSSNSAQGQILEESTGAGPHALAQGPPEAGSSRGAPAGALEEARASGSAGVEAGVEADGTQDVSALTQQTPSISSAAAAAGKDAEEGPLQGPTQGPSQHPPDGSASTSAEDTHKRPLAADSKQAYQTWMVQEYCDLGSLRDSIAHGVFHEGGVKPGSRNYIAVLRSLVDICAGMEYLHGLNLVHGDLTSNNCLLRSITTDIRGFMVKVGDFGLTRALKTNETHTITQSYGTMSYSPPELLSAGRLTKKSDVYAFAIVMWELVSGQQPYIGASLGQVFYSVVYQGHRPIIPVDCNEELAEIIRACWHAEPAERPTFEELHQKLRRLLNAAIRQAAMQQSISDSATSVTSQGTQSSLPNPVASPASTTGVANVGAVKEGHSAGAPVVSAPQYAGPAAYTYMSFTGK